MGMVVGAWTLPSVGASHPRAGEVLATTEDHEVRLTVREAPDYSGALDIAIDGDVCSDGIPVTIRLNGQIIYEKEF